MTYSENELLSCIFDCMEESLPEHWHSAVMKASIVQDTIDASFHYQASETSESKKFVMQNTVAPMNAAIELQKLMAKAGNAWTTIRVNIFSDGRGNYSTE